MDELVQGLQRNFLTRKSYDYDYRHGQLKKLREGLVQLFDAACEGLQKDNGRHRFEVLQEFVFTIGEVDYALGHLHEWIAPERVDVPAHLQPGSATVYKHPKGVVLIISSWNFPYNTCLGPLVGALAAGCAVVLKPSEVSPNSAMVIENLVNGYLDTDMVKVVQGAVKETTQLLSYRWNHIFFTGSQRVGKIIAHAAAESLCSCTMELGGKSPVYVSNKSTNIRVAARRILGTKLAAMGQICVTPDYVLVHREVLDEFLGEITKHMNEWYKDGQHNCSSWGKFSGASYWERVSDLINEDHGGKLVDVKAAPACRDTLFHPMYFVLNPRLDSRIMSEEIFGPILPIICVDHLDQALDVINQRDSSLASYIFSDNSAETSKFIRGIQSGGTSINECGYHLGPPQLPFGGHSGGGSGVGYYHGEAGFREFTHYRSTFKHAMWPDLDVRYPPYQQADENIESVKFYFFSQFPVTRTLYPVLKTTTVLGIMAWVAAKLVAKWN